MANFTADWIEVFDGMEPWPVYAGMFAWARFGTRWQNRPNLIGPRTAYWRIETTFTTESGQQLLSFPSVIDSGESYYANSGRSNVVNPNLGDDLTIMWLPDSGGFRGPPRFTVKVNRRCVHDPVDSQNRPSGSRQTLWERDYTVEVVNPWTLLARQGTRAALRSIFRLWGRDLAISSGVVNGKFATIPVGAFAIPNIYMAMDFASGALRQLAIETGAFVNGADYLVNSVGMEIARTVAGWAATLGGDPAPSFPACQMLSEQAVRNVPSVAVRLREFLPPRARDSGGLPSEAELRVALLRAVRQSLGLTESGLTRYPPPAMPSQMMVWFASAQDTYINAFCTEVASLLRSALRQAPERITVQNLVCSGPVPSMQQRPPRPGPVVGGRISSTSPVLAFDGG